LIEGGLVSKLCVYSGSDNYDEFDESEAPRGLTAWKKVSDVLYRGFNLVGWCLLLRNGSALTQLVKKYSLQINSKVDIGGNSALHFAAKYGDTSTMNFILDSLESFGSIPFETANFVGNTAAIEGVKGGDETDFHAVRILIKRGSNARSALQGKYWAWVLALARQREKINEKSTSDDMNASYFSFYPDPEPNLDLFCASLKAKR